MSEQHNLKEQLCFSLYNAQRQVNRYYSNKVFKKYNLTYPQFLVLTILWDESPVNVKKVVTELALDTGTVSTDKSEMIRPELSNASEKVATASSLSKEEVKELNRLLGKVIDAFIETKEK
ncbi:MAG: MarR family transcriptional regulator [Staphylococcus epidermidis]|nr:MarR family transcriptional regulator [Staphylococcus epidermidis]